MNSSFTLASLLTPISFLVMLTIVVFIHELGHFLAARWCGVTVVAFSIGFGREIFGFVDRHGTRWRIAWIPLGGYVKFLDDENGASVPSREALERLTPEERAGAFHAKPLWQRAVVVAAGPLANFILAVGLLTAILTLYGERTAPPRIEKVVAGSIGERAGFKVGDLVLSIDGTAVDSSNTLVKTIADSAGRDLEFDVERGGSRYVIRARPVATDIPDSLGGTIRIGRLGIEERFYPARIGNTVAGGVADIAGFKPGDLIQAVDGTPVTSFDEVAKLVAAGLGREMTFAVVRGSETVTLRAKPVPAMVVEGGARKEIGRIGISRGESDLDWRLNRFGVLEALQRSAFDTYEVVPRTLGYLKDIVMGRQSADQLGGPIRIAEISGQMARSGLDHWLRAVAFISAAIGLFNLFPIPMLDGGHLLFYGIEAVRRRPLSDRAQEIGFRIGLTCILMLMVFVFWNDRLILQRWLPSFG